MAKTVLIADSSLYSRIILRDILISHGFSVVEVATGEDAIQTYKDKRPELVAIDATLPGVDGVAAVGAILSINPEASIMMCGSRGQRGTMMEGMAVGATGVLLKPFSERQILREIRNAAGKPPLSEPMT